MKRKFIILSYLVLFYCSDSLGQFRVIRSINEIDFIIGPGVSSLRGADDFGESKIKIGYLAGLNFNYYKPNGTKWSFSAKLLYEKKGNRTEKEIFYFIDASTQQLSLGKQISETDIWAITLPLLWQYRIKEGPINFYAEAGVFGSLIKRMETKFSSPDQGSFTNTRNNINEIDWGVSIGIKADYAVTERLTIVIGLLSNVGLVDIINNSAAKTTNASLYIGTKIIKLRHRN